MCSPVAPYLGVWNIRLCLFSEQTAAHRVKKDGLLVKWWAGSKTVVLG